MANICFNRIGFFGNPPTIAKIKNDITLQSKEFYSINYVDDDVRELIIDVESKWSPPVEWVEKISAQYGVTIECEYEEMGSDIWGKFGFRDGELIFAMELPYLEGKYNSMKWNDFIESEVISRIEDNEDVDTFLEDFPFVSDEQKEELITIFNEGN